MGPYSKFCWQIRSHLHFSQVLDALLPLAKELREPSAYCPDRYCAFALRARRADRIVAFELRTRAEKEGVLAELKRCIANPLTGGVVDGWLCNRLTPTTDLLIRTPAFVWIENTLPFGVRSERGMLYYQTLLGNAHNLLEVLLPPNCARLEAVDEQAGTEWMREIEQVGRLTSAFHQFA